MITQNKMYVESEGHFRVSFVVMTHFDDYDVLTYNTIWERKGDFAVSVS